MDHDGASKSGGPEGVPQQVNFFFTATAIRLKTGNFGLAVFQIHSMNEMQS